MSIKIRPMTQADIPLGLQLKSLAGWNQLETDWEAFLQDDLQGNFVAEYKGQPVGTTTTINYNRKFSWIGMVLVHPECRGLGIGTALLKHAITHAKPFGAIGLDATAAGAKLYRKLGFKTSSKWIRMKREADASFSGNLSIPSKQQAFASIYKYDSEAFGAHRDGLLTNFYHRNQQLFYSTLKEQINGYILSRQGSEALQIGPLVANGEGIARDLLTQMISLNSYQALFIDTFVHQKSWLEFLESLGFVKQRAFERMYLGRSDWGLVYKQFALAGPEFG